MGLNCITGLAALPFYTRMTSSLLGYFNLGDTPVLRLSRSNFLQFIALLLFMGSLLLGGEIESITMFSLMCLNLLDVYCASVFPPSNNNISVLQSSRSSEIENFLLTSWRNNSFN